VTSATPAFDTRSVALAAPGAVVLGDHQGLGIVRCLGKRGCPAACTRKLGPAGDRLASGHGRHSRRPAFQAGLLDLVKSVDWESVFRPEDSLLGVAELACFPAGRRVC
jgi:hypothetical protein